MAKRQWHEELPESIQQRLEEGLGGSRDKEYAIAPYCQMVQASVDEELWSAVFFSWLSMKGHLQGLHEMERTELFVTKVGGIVYATFIVIWTRQEAFVEWLQHGYPVEEMLRAMGVTEEKIRATLVRDFS